MSTKWKGSCEKEQEFNFSLCNFKLVGAKYFNKGLLNSNKTLKISMNSARDSTGHGTYVSTIIAGNYVNKVSFLGYGHGTASGVVPRAMLAMYKVVWDYGNSYFSDIITAIDEVVADGIDAINISLSMIMDYHYLKML
ncbi:hypothetical protein L3X38_016957 [Prunus dulcis]|uniref:Peptidase S8/S53 domain-containing protein n=1 Tax=Prunus dulcis TaxID=3755 RepID=A0AAD4Z9L5_PRUDU|nr:hypothetical protein L3X38_016957 [Prunus dulcis]